MWQLTREILSALLLIGALQGFIICVPLLRYKNNRAPNRILVALTILLAADLLFAFFNNSPIALRFPGLYDLNASLPFLFTPGMYLYVSVMTGKIDRFRWRYLLHAIPFLAHALFMFLVFYGLDPSAKREIIQALLDSGRFIDRAMFFISYQGGRPHGGTLVFIAVLVLIAIGYVVAIVRRVISYRKELREFYSDIKNKVLGFLIFILITTISVWVLVTIVLVSGAKLQVIPMIVYTIAIYIGTYAIMTAPEVFSGNRAMNSLLAPSGQEPKGWHEISIERLTEFLGESKAYLNPELTIGDIGARIDVPVHRLSKALNQHLGKNFYQFINEFRVGEAKRLLCDKRLSDRAVLAIGMDAGFSSKSTFNDAFKKMTGLTPSEYRKRQLAIAHSASE